MDVLVYRFSSMGDVALIVPVIRGVLVANPSLVITMLTDQRHAPLFHEIERCDFLGIDLNEYTRVGRLYNLFVLLRRKKSWSMVIDLHDVLRTWFLNFMFRLVRVPVYQVNKGRRDKHALTRRKNKILHQLPHTTERYLSVFHQAGLKGIIEQGRVILFDKKRKFSIDEFLKSNGLGEDNSWIGFAPFTTTPQKQWSFAKSYALVQALITSHGAYVFLFGGGNDEIRKLKEMSQMHEKVINVAGMLTLEDQIGLVQQMDLMVSMDSFNMHLAALSNVPVVSIWGGTHQYAGFGPINNFDSNVVEIPPSELTCRPCSVFGQKQCYRGDLACLEQLEVDTVLKKIEEVLNITDRKK